MRKIKKSFLRIGFGWKQPLEFLDKNVDLLLSGDEDEDAAVRQRSVDLADLAERLVYVLALADRGTPIEMGLKKQVKIIVDK